MVTLQRLEEMGWLKESTPEVSESLTKIFFQREVLIDAELSICHFLFFFLQAETVVSVLKLFLVLCTELRLLFFFFFFYFSFVQASISK